MTALVVIVLGWCESVTVRLAYYADELDGYVQTKAGAARWRAGAGKTPSKEEMDEIRRLTPVAHILAENQDLGVTDEYFDYLANRAASPAEADAKMVTFFRSMRGKVRHRP
jgi:hypothetical protein